jgi:hypothetical protein
MMLIDEQLQLKKNWCSVLRFQTKKQQDHDMTLLNGLEQQQYQQMT